MFVFEYLKLVVGFGICCVCVYISDRSGNGVSLEYSVCCISCGLVFGFVSIALRRLHSSHCAIFCFMPGCLEVVGVPVGVGMFVICVTAGFGCVLGRGSAKLDSGLLNLDSGFRVLSAGFLVFDSGFWILDSRFWMLGSVLFLSFGFWFLDS